MAYAIEVRGLVKRYGEKPALNGVDFVVPAGQVCGYLGPNGAGKSTTLNILSGILAPDAGAARVAGHDVVEDALDAKRGLGFLPESGALYSLLSVREHLHLCADLHGVEPEETDARLATLWDLFDLKAVADRRIDTLSKGQRQKTALCATLLHDPDVILLDEPLNGLDVHAAGALKDILRDLAAQGRTILYSSHILDVVERLCDRVVILDEGRVVADAPTAELAGTRTLEEAFHALTRAHA